MIQAKEKSRAEAKRGLDNEEVLRSRGQYGKNILSQRKRKSFLRHFLSNLNDPVIRILLCALCVNLFFVFRGGDIFETVGIAVSVFLAAFISTLSERGSESAFARLSQSAQSASFRVRREGATVGVPIEDIVVGDIVTVGSGEQIPADAFVIDGELTVDQSAMTGENREIYKKYVRNCKKTPDSEGAVFRGSTVLAGRGEICVFAVGDETYLGKISQEIQTDTRESPLKIRLTKLAKQISILGYIAAVLIAVAYLFNVFIIDSGYNAALAIMKIKNTAYLLEKLLHAFMLGLTVIVVAVPERIIYFDCLLEYIIPRYEILVNRNFEKIVEKSYNVKKARMP